MTAIDTDQVRQQVPMPRHVSWQPPVPATQELRMASQKVSICACTSTMVPSSVMTAVTPPTSQPGN